MTMPPRTSSFGRDKKTNTIIQFREYKNCSIQQHTLHRFNTRHPSVPVKSFDMRSEDACPVREPGRISILFSQAVWQNTISGAAE